MRWVDPTDYRRIVRSELSQRERLGLFDLVDSDRKLRESGSGIDHENRFDVDVGVSEHLGEVAELAGPIGHRYGKDLLLFEWESYILELDSGCSFVAGQQLEDAFAFANHARECSNIDARFAEGLR